MKSNPFKCLFALVAFAAVGLAIYFLALPGQSTDGRSKRHEAVRLTARKPMTVNNLAMARDEKLKEQPPRRVKKKRNRSQRPDDVSPADRKILDAVDLAVNAEDFEEVLRLTVKLANSTNETVRLRVVEALGWFDDAALPELTPFLMDSDEGVRDAARDQWSASLDQVSDMDFKASVIEATMQIVNDPDLLEDIAFHFNELPTFTAVDSLVALINGDNEAAAEAALETYSFLTGVEYSSLEEAQQWVDENIDFDDEPDDMPVYRASVHPEVFDENVDLTGVKVVNDTDMEIPPRAGSESKEAADAESVQQNSDASDDSAYEADTE
jgi:hypothetical protein